AAPRAEVVLEHRPASRGALGAFGPVVRAGTIRSSAPGARPYTRSQLHLREAVRRCRAPLGILVHLRRQLARQPIGQQRYTHRAVFRAMFLPVPMRSIVLKQ
ncbi:MAG TPA: hypothetical protein VF506_15620, partial [Streptosporangiaceae bacterium]